MPLAYVVNTLDRKANDRPDSSWIATQRARPDAKLVRISGNSAVLRDGQLLTGNAETGPLTVFLGLDSTLTPWFACKTEETEGLRDLRSLAMEEALPPEQLGILAQARSLIQWHERRTSAPIAARRTKSPMPAIAVTAPSCKVDHFPRTDPVVIIVVAHEERILLGRQAAWKEGMYSALAGFVEPGETIEDAARREVFEESGVRVGAIRYVASQPWPFLSNLMIGLDRRGLRTRSHSTRRNWKTPAGSAGGSAADGGAHPSAGPARLQSHGDRATREGGPRPLSRPRAELHPRAISARYAA